MTNYIVIPVLALMCYLLFLLAFLASKKTKLIHSFILLLCLLSVYLVLRGCSKKQIEKSYVCLLDYSGDVYKVVQSSSPLDEKRFSLKKGKNTVGSFTVPMKEMKP